MKKSSENKKQISIDEFKRHTGALAEHFDDGIKILGERISGVEENLNKKMDEKFDKVHMTLDSHSEMIGQVMQDIEEIKSGLKKKVDYDDFAKLEQRVVRLEARIHS